MSQGVDTALEQNKCELEQTMATDGPRQQIDRVAQASRNAWLETMVRNCAARVTSGTSWTPFGKPNGTSMLNNSGETAIQGIALMRWAACQKYCE